MLHVERILFAADFTASSLAALPVAHDLARRTGAELHVLYVETERGERYGPHPSSHAHDVRILERLRAMAPPDDRVRVLPAVERDRAAAPAILAYTREHAIDLVVTGRRGRHGLARVVLGSTAEEVVRRAPCPVLTVGGAGAAGAGTLSKIVVPVDFSVHSREALHHAKALAAYVDADVDLLHVFEADAQPLGFDATAFPSPDLVPQRVEQTEEHLWRFYHEVEGPPDAVRFVVRSGRAVHEIPAYAAERGADLVVLSTHGLTGLSHLLMGSVAERVVRTAPCPVLTVKAYGRSLVRPEVDELFDDLDVLEG